MPGLIAEQGQRRPGESRQMRERVPVQSGIKKGAHWRGFLGRGVGLEKEACHPCSMVNREREEG
jgi:hypothetical protein